MISSTWCYDFSELKETFELHLLKENQFSISLDIEVKNEKGNMIPLKAEVTFLNPPDEFPDHAMIIKREATGKGSRQYKDKAMRSIYHKLRRYSIPYTFSRTEKTYKGLIKEGNGYKPYIFDPSDEGMRLVATERTKFDQKHHYFECEGHYYTSIADPLTDVTSDQMERSEKWVNKIMSENRYVIGERKELAKTYPVSLFKGYAPIYYFSQQLRFDTHYNSSSYKASAVVPAEGNRMGYTDFKRFLYANQKQENEIVSRVQVFDSTLRGEELPVYKPGDKVRVSRPNDKRKPILHFEGIVQKNVMAKVQVEFFGYFKENFEPEELEKIQ